MLKQLLTLSVVVIATTAHAENMITLNGYGYPESEVLSNMTDVISDAKSIDDIKFAFEYIPVCDTLRLLPTAIAAAVPQHNLEVGLDNYQRQLQQQCKQ